MQKYVIALYIRLSIEDYKYDSLSIENQSLVLHEYVASMPEALNAETMEFIDNGYSGTNFERPQVQKLIELVRANQIDCIIVKDFSRFGRNSIETGYFIERVFPLFHTRFISISDDFDSSKFKGDTGGMDVAFKYLISEYYSRDMSIKTKSAKYAKMQRGEYQSKICPYGYRKSADGRMEPDPEAAAVVQLIFQLAAEGINATAITRELFRRNIPTPGQYKAAHGNHTHDISRCHGIWSASTILRILEDERYTGVYVIGKRAVLEVGGNRSRLKDRESWYIIPDHHPAIVEKAVFDTVQASQLRFSQPNKKKRDYPLKGKAFCGCCGHALSRTMQKTSYYYCRHSEADVESRCHKMRLNAAELEQVVFLTLKKQLEAAAPLAPDGTLGEQKPVAHQEKNHAKQRHIDQRHKTLADPADHEHIDRRAEEHGDPYRQHHADKVVGHADHIDNELDHDQHRGEQHRGDHIPDRPFICFFHKRLLVFDTSFSNIVLGILFISQRSTPSTPCSRSGAVPYGGTDRSFSAARPESPSQPRGRRRAGRSDRRS